MNRTHRCTFRRKFHTTCPERVGNKRAGQRLRMWYGPRLLGEFRDFNLAASDPSILLSRHNTDAFVIENVRRDILVNRWPDTSENHVDPPLAQFAVLLRVRHHRHHMYRDSWITSAEPTEHRRDQPGVCSATLPPVVSQQH